MSLWQRIWNMDSTGIKLILLILVVAPACSGFDVTVDRRPPAGTVGDSVLFAVSINPPPGSLQFVAWTFNTTNIITYQTDNTIINPIYSGRIVFNSSTGSLELKNLTVEDTGRYTVNIQSTEANQKQKSVDFAVYEPVSNVAMRANATDLVEFNDTVSVKCFANGSSLTFQWLNGSSHITVSERVHLSDNNQTLTISNVLRSDWGPISCNVSNIISSEMSAPLILNISFGPDNTSVTVTPEEQFYSSGSSISLFCSAQSSPDAQFQWHFNGAKLDKVGKELKLENIQLSQSGNYSCWTHNTVTLQYQSSEPSLITVIEKISGATIFGLTAELIAGSSSLNLSCQASAGSISNRLWLKDGQSLSPSNRVTFTADNSSMNINTVKKDDGGWYKCILSNPISTGTAERNVVVNYGPESVTVQGETSVKINTRVVLQCSASSVPPADFTWRFNGTLTDVKTATFIIEKASYSNSGDYVCTASNAVTELEFTSAHTLVVKDDMNHGSGGLSGGAIAAIVIVLLLVFAGVGAGIFTMKKKKVWLFADGKAGNTQHPQPTGQQEETVYTDVTCVRKPNGEQAKQGQSNGQSSQMPTSPSETEYSTVRVAELQPEKVIYSQVKA